MKIERDFSLKNILKNEKIPNIHIFDNKLNKYVKVDVNINSYNQVIFKYGNKIICQAEIWKNQSYLRTKGVEDGITLITLESYDTLFSGGKIKYAGQQMMRVVSFVTETAYRKGLIERPEIHLQSVPEALSFYGKLGFEVYAPYYTNSSSSCSHLLLEEHKEEFNKAQKGIESRLTIYLALNLSSEIFQHRNQELHRNISKQLFQDSFYQSTLNFSNDVTFQFASFKRVRRLGGKNIKRQKFQTN